MTLLFVGTSRVDIQQLLVTGQTSENLRFSELLGTPFIIGFITLSGSALSVSVANSVTLRCVQGMVTVTLSGSLQKSIFKIFSRQHKSYYLYCFSRQ